MTILSVTLFLPLGGCLFVDAPSYSAPPSAPSCCALKYGTTAGEKNMTGPVPAVPSPVHVLEVLRPLQGEALRPMPDDGG